MSALVALFSFLALLQLSWADSSNEAGKKIWEDCMKENSIDEETLKSYVESSKLPESENGKCFLQCLVEKGGSFKDGKIDENLAKEQNKRFENPEIRQKADMIVDSCGKEVPVPKEGEKCVYGYEYTKCFAKHCNEMGLKLSDFH